VKPSLLKRIFPFSEPPRKEVRIVFLFAFALFFLIDLSIAVTTLLPENWDERETIDIVYASMELIEVGEFGRYYTVKIEAFDGRIYKIDSLLTRHMDLGALESFLFRAGDVTLITYRNNWTIGIEADDNVFLDYQQSIRIIEQNDIANLVFSIPFFTAVSLYFMILSLGTNKIRSIFHKRRKSL
jgi:hypothetical protein